MSTKFEAWYSESGKFFTFVIKEGDRTTNWQIKKTATANKWFKILDEIVSELSEALPPSRPRSKWLDNARDSLDYEKEVDTFFNSVAEAAAAGEDHFSDETGDYNIVSTAPRQSDEESLAALQERAQKLQHKWFENPAAGFEDLPFHETQGTGDGE